MAVAETCGEGFLFGDVGVVSELVRAGPGVPRAAEKAPLVAIRRVTEAFTQQAPSMPRTLLCYVLWVVIVRSRIAQVGAAIPKSGIPKPTHCGRVDAAASMRPPLAAAPEHLNRPAHAVLGAFATHEYPGVNGADRVVGTPKRPPQRG